MSSIDRRKVILAGAALASGCAAPAPAPAPSQTASTPGPIAPPSTPPPPPPPLPPDNPAFLARPALPLTPTGDARFDAWRAHIMEYWGEAWRPYLERLFGGLRPIQVQPEPLPPLGQDALYFIRRVVTAERIAEGRRQVGQDWLNVIARRKGVPPQVLAAVWGAETNYGKEQGTHDLLAFWATRAGVGDGYRDQDFAEVAKLVIADRIPREVMRCFPDGSFGQVRWMPTQFAAWGEDGDLDGLIDPWRSASDAVAGVGNVLERSWERGGWLAEVVLPTGDDPQTQRLLQSLGRGAQIRSDLLKRADGRGFHPDDIARGGQLIQPAGPSGPALLTLRNFDAIRYLNGTYRGRLGDEPARGWAVAVGLLANAIAGEPPLTRPL